MGDDTKTLGPTPYRAAPTEPVRTAARVFEAAWHDGEDVTGPFSAGLTAVSGLLLAAVTASMLPPAGLGLAGVTAGWWFWQRRRLAVARVRAEMHDGTLLLWAAGARDSLELPLEALREVTIERKTTQRIIHRREIGDALPTTALSGEVDLGRIVLQLDPPEAPRRLSESYAANIECMECFGKFRVFLRSHGWLPESERPDPEPEAEAAPPGPRRGD